jgi:hypothetical protein
MKIHQLDGDVLFDCDLRRSAPGNRGSEDIDATDGNDDFSSDSASRRRVSRIAI